MDDLTTVPLEWLPLAILYKQIDNGSLEDAFKLAMLPSPIIPPIPPTEMKIKMEPPKWLERIRDVRSREPKT